MGIRFYMKWFGRALAACAVLFATACDDRLPEASDARVATEPTPVHIEVSRVALRAASGAATRTAPSLREWKNGDAIQITAVFTGDEGMSDPLQYCCYKYDSISVAWVPDGADKELFWPVGVKSAEFTAYYVEGIKGTFSDRTDVQDFVFLLGDIGEGSDPLYCKLTNVQYGESVHIDFQHLCTHLTLNDVKTNISDIYWLYGNADGTKTSAEIPNAYKLIYKPANKTLEFSFEYSPKSTTGGSVDVLGEGEHYVISRNKDINKNWVDFYLAPSTKGDGETREPDVTYTYGQNCKLNYVNNHPYLSFTSEELNALQAGYHYELSVERSTGIVPEPQTDFPETPSTDLGYVHIPDLLDGIVNNRDVRDINDQLVLKSAGEAYPRLLRDVDFHNFNPMDYIEGTGDFDPMKGEGETPVPKELRTGAHSDWKLPRMESRKLDGNYHSFLHVAYPIFYSVNSGEIYNLAIRQSKLDITVDEIKRMDNLSIQGMGASEGSTNTEFGILSNIFAGKLSRLLLEDVDMTVHLDQSLWTGSAGITYSVGCVTGKQSTSDLGGVAAMENVELRGNVKLTVKTDVDGTISSQQDICAGVIAGQNGATIDGITCTESLLNDSSSPVPGKCTLSLSINGNGNVFAGGLAGKNVMTIQNVSLDVKVDASKVKTYQCYVGGLCGEFVNENEKFGSLLDCAANVEVTGGTTYATNLTTYAYSYCGGIAGRVQNAEAGDIYISGTVTGGTEEGETPNPTMRVIATGGGFGYVTSSGNVHDCHVRAGVQAAQLTIADVWGNHTGRFVGMTSDTFTEGDGKNNSAQSGDYDFVGIKASEPTGGG